jgi:prepilin-type processing-associated H-X9-DG protein
VIKACPTWDTEVLWGIGSGQTKPGYGMNIRVTYPERDWTWAKQPPPGMSGDWGTQDNPIKINWLHHASQRIVYGDSVDWHLYSQWNGVKEEFPFDATTKKYISGDPFRHNKIANYCFVDGHAEGLDADRAAHIVLNADH